MIKLLIIKIIWINTNIPILKPILERKNLKLSA
jgi:hypothetical protein